MEKNIKIRSAGENRFRKKFAERDKNQPSSKIIEIDKEILKLLLKRYRFLCAMRERGELDAKEEKHIREAWQQCAGRISRDPDLSGRFYSFLNQLNFLKKPSLQSNPEGEQPVEKNGYNLAPAEKPIHFEYEAPLADWDTFAWLYLATASGQPIHLQPCLQNDLQIDFIKTLVQMGGAVSREEQAIVTRSFPPLPTPDRVINVGNSEFAFYLLLAHYIGQPSRAKFTGGANLKTADFSAIRHFLPLLQARLITLIPRMDGLPARLESAGILPPGINIGPQIPALFAEALILCAPFYSSPFMIDLEDHPENKSILAHVLPVLKNTGAVYKLAGNAISLEPCLLSIPARPELPMEPELAAFLLAFTVPLTGNVNLKGRWPDWPELRDIWQVGMKTGWQKNEYEVYANVKVPLSLLTLESELALPHWGIALLTAIACCVALKGGKSQIPVKWMEIPEVEDILRMAGLKADQEGLLGKEDAPWPMSWNAPTPAWVMAAALGACARRDKKGWLLGNPAEIMDLWPLFWKFYNTLPTPILITKPIDEVAPKATRKRIKTLVNASFPDKIEEGKE